jgi:hypothetical protein
MVNWYDIQVEMEIAQERYQALVKARQIERLTATKRIKSGFYQTILNWLGQQLVGWGYNLQHKPNATLNTLVTCD